MHANVQHPLIFQNIPLPELAPGVVIYVERFVDILTTDRFPHPTTWLLRFHRAGPSTSLDKSVARGY